MMKRFKQIAVFAATSLMAVSCSGSGKTSGLYTFMLGKENSTSVGVKLLLDEEAFTTEKEPIKKIIEGKDAKKFNFKILMNTVDEEGKPVDITKILMELFKDGIDGYYYIDTTTTPNKLHLGIDTDLDIFATIPPEYVERIIYSTIEGKKVNLQIPVSLDDMFMSFCWQGDLVMLSRCDNNIYTHIDFEKYGYFSSEFDHSPGSKIKKEGINAMNLDFSGYFCNTVVKLRYAQQGIPTNTTVAGLYNEIVYKDEEYQYSTYLEYYPEYKELLNLNNTDLYLCYYDKKEEKNVTNYDINFTLSGNNKIVEARHESNPITDFYKMVSDKFVFRTPHYVNIGLTKTEEIKK